jgi:hypothetical protein
MSHTEQPNPTPATGDTWQEIIDSLPDGALRNAAIARRQLGIERYGTPLQRNNGRDNRRDLVEELLDAMAYAHNEPDGSYAAVFVQRSLRQMLIALLGDQSSNVSMPVVMTALDEWRREVVQRLDRMGTPVHPLESTPAAFADAVHREIGNSINDWRKDLREQLAARGITLEEGDLGTPADWAASIADAAEESAPAKKGPSAEKDLYEEAIRERDEARKEANALRANLKDLCQRFDALGTSYRSILQSLEHAAHACSTLHRAGGSHAQR